MTKLINPAPDAVLGNPYGPRGAFDANGFWTGDGHEGQDFKNNGKSFRIYAAAAGRVASIGFEGGNFSGEFGYNRSGGNSIIITHDDVPGVNATGYAHLSSINVKAGQMVKAGQFLGMAGTTGASTGIHLHFDVFQGRWQAFNRVDPMKYIGSGSGQEGEDDMFTEEDRKMLKDAVAKANAVYAAVFGARNLNTSKRPAPMTWVDVDGVVKTGNYGLMDVAQEDQKREAANTKSIIDKQDASTAAILKAIRESK